MLTGVIIAPQISEQLSARLAEMNYVRITRSFSAYPTEADLIRYIQLTGPALIFLSTEDPLAATGLALAVDRSGVGTQVIAVGETSDPQVLVEIMRAGIREFLPVPFEAGLVAEAMRRVMDVLARKPLQFHSTDAVFSFLPAKPGDGTSTVALNTSFAIVRNSRLRTLIMDMDLSLGMVSFLLKISGGRSVLDAASFADNLDETVWNELITHRDGLDVLCSGRLDPGHVLDASRAEDVLHFARRSYATICLDFSGSMEPFSIELLRQSKEVFVVCTPEVPSLHFARAKMDFLRQAGLEERVSVIMNRSERRNLFSIRDAEKLLGSRVRFSFMNDAKQVGKAMSAASSVDPKSDLGRQFDAFAKCLATGDTGEAPDPNADPAAKKRFIEYFAVVPSTYHVDNGKRR